MISEPADLIPSTLVNQRRRKAGALLKIKDLLQDLLLASTSRDKGDVDSVGDNGQSEGNALRRGLGRVGLSSNPSVLFAQQVVAREERASVAVGTAAQQDEIEDGKLDAVLAGKLAHQVLLVEIGEFLGVVIFDVLLVDGVDDGRAELGGDLGDQLVLQQAVVALLVVEGYGALVGEENVPLGELGDILGGTIAGGEEGLGQDGGQGTTGDSDAEAIVAGKGGILAAEDVAAQLRRKSVGAGEAVEIGVCGGHDVLGEVRGKSFGLAG